MQLPEEVKKLVCFVHTAGGGQEDLGTGFFVFDMVGANDAKGIPQSIVYLVTARHCVQRDPDEEPAVESIRVRLNTTDGGSNMIDTEPLEWVHHDTADVSIYSFGVGARAHALAPYDFLYYPIRPWPGPQYLSSSGEKRAPDSLVAPGTEVFMTGLLVHHPGETRIMPIIRVGNIAAVPEEPIYMTTGRDRVILMESRSIGGLSGSPVFARFPPSRYDEDWKVEHLAPPRLPNNAGPNYLIGVNRGASDEPLNTGISIIVPIERVLDLIDGPKLKAERDEAKDALLAAGAPKKHSARATPGSSAFDRFEDLTRKLVQVPKPEISEKQG